MVQSKKEVSKFSGNIQFAFKNHYQERYQDKLSGASTLTCDTDFDRRAGSASVWVGSWQNVLLFVVLAKESSGAK